VKKEEEVKGDSKDDSLPEANPTYGSTAFDDISGRTRRSATIDAHPPAHSVSTKSEEEEQKWHMVDDETLSPEQVPSIGVITSSQTVQPPSVATPQGNALECEFDTDSDFDGFSDLISQSSPLKSIVKQHDEAETMETLPAHSMASPEPSEMSSSQTNMGVFGILKARG
jgi:hypothetical protein